MLTCALHPNLFCLPDNKTLPYHLRQYLYWWRCMNVLLILSIMWAVHLLDKPGSLHKRACVTIKVRNEGLTVFWYVCVCFLSVWSVLLLGNCRKWYTHPIGSNWLWYAACWCIGEIRFVSVSKFFSISFSIFVWLLLHCFGTVGRVAGKVSSS